jgi:membrane protein DedA with SNARE-associated domain
MLNLSLILDQISYYKYFLVFLFSIIEGPVVMTFSGFLWRNAYFNFLPLYLALMAGDLTADALWYSVGYFGGIKFIEKYGKFFNISEEKVLKFKNIFHNHQTKILFLSKITMGFGFALVVLIAAGISKVPFKKYITINFFGQIIWTLFLMFLGYFFGSIYLIIDKGLKIGFIIFMVLFVMFLMYGFNKYMQSKSKI